MPPPTGRRRPRRTPPRISLFGLTRLPARYLQVLRSLAVHRDVHLLLVVTNCDVERTEPAHAEHEPGGVGLLVRADLDVVTAGEGGADVLDGEATVLHLDDGVHLEAESSLLTSPVTR